MVAAMLCLGTSSASEPYLTVDHQISPTEIWSVDSGSMPNQSQVTLTIRGEGDPQEIPVEAILAIDSSSNMNGSDPKYDRLLTAESFIMAMNFSRDRVGVVSFDNDVDFAQPLTGNLSSAINKTHEIDSEGGANLDAGLNASIDLLVGNDTAPGAAKVILLLTDGNGSYTPSGEAGSPADRAKEAGIEIYAIGLNLNDSAAEERLMNMTIATGGRFYKMVENDTIESIYREICRTTIAGENTSLVYTMPTSFNASAYSIEPGSVAMESGVTFLMWDLGTILTSDSLNLSFNISTNEEGKFNLVGAVGFEQFSDLLGYLELETRSIDVLDYKSGISIKMIDGPENFSSYFGSIAEHADQNPLFESAKYDEDHIVLEYADTHDNAFIFEDGRLVVASDGEFTLDKRDELHFEISYLFFGLEQSGIRITERDRNSMFDHAVYYAQEAVVYCDMLIGLDDDFSCSLNVPNCTILEARLAITGEDPIELDPKGLCYYIDGKHVDCCWGFPDLPFVPVGGAKALALKGAASLFRYVGYDSCTVPPSDIANRISSPGVHEISVTEVDAVHTMSIEVIASPCTESFELILEEDEDVIREGASSDILALISIMDR
ncbi:MAG TPA: VWA domain-containing protein [Methanothrix sp.]|nr:VWA domain-containing protein [Methanothrix sp.]